MKRALTLIVLATTGVALAQEPPRGDEPPAPSPAETAEEDCEAYLRCERFYAAKKLLSGWEFVAAERAFRALVEEDPANGPAWFYLGYALHKMERYEEALEVHLRAARCSRFGPSALYNAGCACALLGRPDEAFAWIEKAFEAGFDNRSLVECDSDLDSLRDDPRLERFLPIDEPSEPFVGDVRVLHTFVGEAAGDQFGWQGRNAGDCDGDGRADLVISAPYESSGGPNAGRIYLYSGRSGELLFQRSGRSGDNLGIGVENAGDVNGDGRADVIAGAPHGQVAGRERRAGRAYVFSGADGSTLLELSRGEPGDGFGWQVAGSGDLNADGYDDVLVGAPGSDHTAKDAGRVFAYSGRDGELLFTVDGERAHDETGTAVAGWVDAQRRLLAVGACNAGAGARGRVTVYSVEYLRPRRLFTIEADDTGQDLGQSFVSFVGDVDADGVVDVFASDWENKARGRATGRVYVHSGRTGERLLTMTGEHAGDRFGAGVGRAGDVDGDGRDDLVVGAWRSGEGAPSAGKCYVFSGADGTLLRQVVSRKISETFGFDAVGVGDLDGDGANDFLVTAARGHGCGKRSGRAYVIAGSGPDTRLATPVSLDDSAPAGARDE